MKQIDQIDRHQMTFSTLECLVDQESVVRVVDVFVDFAEEDKLGFKADRQITGRPSYPVRTFIGLYIYGYLNKLRSSRDLEKACKTNVELWWLLRGQKPCYKTIANFRKDNKKGFRNLFVKFRSFCKQMDLYGKEVIAVDGSKFRAQNSMKNNYTEKKIDRHLEYINDKEEEYIKGLDEQDKLEAIKDPTTHDRLTQLAERKLTYEQLKEKLLESKETQISTTDPDARALPIKMSIVEVAYNLQSVVDAKNKLIVDYEITNKSDYRALAPMAVKAKSALGLKEEDTLIVLADKGYHTGEQMQTCHNHNIDTLVAIPRRPKQVDKTKPANLRKENFAFDGEKEIYRCPSGEKLTKQATYQRKDRTGKLAQKFDRYSIKFSKCKACKFLDQCVSKSNQLRHHGRYIDRYHTDQAVKRNEEFLKDNKELYKKRQAIVEHPFGTMKRGWGYTHTMMKTIPKVQTEFSIIMLCYNLRRAMSILGINGLKEALKSPFDPFFMTRGLMKGERIDHKSYFCPAA